MGTVYKVLGQACPGATGLTGLYVVPGATGPTGGMTGPTNTVCSSITMTDVGGNGGGFAVSVAVGGATDAPAQYIYGGPTGSFPLDAWDTFIATIGITLGPGDQVRVRSSGAGEISFSLFGSEIA